MESEVIRKDEIIEEIMIMPNCKYLKQELEEKTYFELLDLREELYGFTSFNV